MDHISGRICTFIYSITSLLRPISTCHKRCQMRRKVRFNAVCSHGMILSDSQLVVHLKVHIEQEFPLQISFFANCRALKYSLRRPSPSFLEGRFETTGSFILAGTDVGRTWLRNGHLLFPAAIIPIPSLFPPFTLGFLIWSSGNIWLDLFMCVNKSENCAFFPIISNRSWSTPWPRDQIDCVRIRRIRLSFSSNYVTNFLILNLVQMGWKTVQVANRCDLRNRQTSETDLWLSWPWPLQPQRRRPNNQSLRRERRERRGV